MAATPPGFRSVVYAVNGGSHRVEILERLYNYAEVSHVLRINGLPSP